jgi:excisionase family DNA binding protein
MDRQIKHKLTEPGNFGWDMPDKPFLTIGEVANILQVSSRTVYNLIYKGTLRACRLSYHITIITWEDFSLMIKETTYCKRSVSIFAKQGKKKKKMNVNRQNIEKAELSQKEGKNKPKGSPKRQLIPATNYKQSVRGTFTDSENAGNEEKERRSAELDSEIADKEERARKADRESTDNIKSGIANLLGKGKYAAIEKENARLKAENERIRKAFPGAVNNKVEEGTKALATEKQEIEAERDRALAQNRSLGMERDKAVRQLQEQRTGEQHRINMAVFQATEEKDKTIRLLQGALKSSRNILNLLADILYKASEVFRRAVDAIIHFGTEQHKSIFAPSEAADIKSVMQEYGETAEQQKAVGAWLCGYAEHRQPFDEIKHRHTLNEVGDVAEGKYNWKIEREQDNGINM